MQRTMDLVAIPQLLWSRQASLRTRRSPTTRVRLMHGLRNLSGSCCFSFYATCISNILQDTCLCLTFGDLGLISALYLPVADPTGVASFKLPSKSRQGRQSHLDLNKPIPAMPRAESCVYPLTMFDLTMEPVWQGVWTAAFEAQWLKACH